MNGWMGCTEQNRTEQNRKSRVFGGQEENRVEENKVFMSEREGRMSVSRGSIRDEMMVMSVCSSE